MTVRWRPLAAGEIDHERLWSLLAIATGASAALALLTLGLPPIDCAFKTLTGWPCPTCGATRALLALLHGHASESLALHPMVLPGAAASAAYAPYGLAISLLDRPRLRIELTPRDWRIVRAITLATAVGVWGYLIAAGR